jgi:type IV pilus assembly protein PilV
MKAMRHLPNIENRGLGSQKGSALIEALVAMLIFAFGVLGFVGLQGAMLRSQSDAKLRTDAAFLADQVIGLASSDRPNLASYVTSPGTVCAYAKCTDWVNKVGNSLPAGQATVTYTAATGAFSITLAWTMPDGTSHQFVVATSIN